MAAIHSRPKTQSDHQITTICEHSLWAPLPFRVKESSHLPWLSFHISDLHVSFFLTVQQITENRKRWALPNPPTVLVKEIAHVRHHKFLKHSVKPWYYLINAYTRNPSTQEERTQSDKEQLGWRASYKSFLPRGLAQVPLRSQQSLLAHVWL